jgi:glycosyltransferase involved in cell wall biosynthesis
MVARVALLAHHFTRIQIPQLRTWRERLNIFRKSNLHPRKIAANRQRAHETISQADVVSVLNDLDREELERSGIPAGKIVVIPNGMSGSRAQLFERVGGELPDQPTVVFVGTFDSRKGAKDFPRLLAEIVARVPTVRFRLLGTAGRYQTEEEVRGFFPALIQERMEVIPRFEPDRLPELLSTGSVGVFPSYIEGFGLGVLEMLAASIPVIAYHAPGPPCMLPPEYLVPAGDTRALAAKVAELLADPERLRRAREWARKRAQDFSWKQVAERTSEIYRALCMNKRTAVKAPLPG